MRFRLPALALLVACGSYGAEESRPVDAGTADAGSEAATDSALVDAGQGAEGGPDVAPACPGAAACERVVFVSSVQFKGGDLGGVTGGDKLCTSLAGAIDAHARVKGRKFRAWLSSSASSPSNVFVQGTMPYVKPSGERIASNWTSLTSSVLESAFDEDEKGVQLVAGSRVWTGTLHNGRIAGAISCDGWMSDSAFLNGAYGESLALNFTWSESGTEQCDATNRIYCFEE